MLVWSSGSDSIQRLRSLNNAPILASVPPSSANHRLLVSASKPSCLPMSLMQVVVWRGFMLLCLQDMGTGKRFLWHLSSLLRSTSRHYHWFPFEAVLRATCVPQEGIPYGFPTESLFGYKVILALYYAYSSLSFSLTKSLFRKDRKPLFGTT